MSTIKADTIQTASGGATNLTGHITAKGWMNFNGKNTVAIRASSNFSSITDYGTGYYGCNISTAMSDANYACPSISGNALTNPSDGHLGAVASTSSLVKARCYTSSTDAYDQECVSVSLFR
jgi:Zn-dependent membrane protease YugP